MLQYSSLAEKQLDQWEIVTHQRAFQIQDKSRDYDPHLDQTKFNELLLLTIDGVLVCEVHLKEMEVQINFPASTSSGCRGRDRNGTVAKPRSTLGKNIKPTLKSSRNRLTLAFTFNLVRSFRV